ncbi:S-type pyocin domain-containing protein [Pseudomonas caspiana]
MVTRKKRQTNLLHDTTTGTVNIGHGSSAQRPNIGFFGSGFTNTRGSSRKRRRRRQQAIAQQRAKERARVEALARAEAQARDRAQAEAHEREEAQRRADAQVQAAAHAIAERERADRAYKDTLSTLSSAYHIESNEFSQRYKQRSEELASSLNQELDALTQPSSSSNPELQLLDLILEEKARINYLISSKASQLEAENLRSSAADAVQPFPYTAEQHQHHLVGNSLGDAQRAQRLHEVWREGTERFYEQKLLAESISVLSDKSKLLSEQYAEAHLSKHIATEDSPSNSSVGAANNALTNAAELWAMVSAPPPPSARVTTYGGTVMEGATRIAKEQFMRAVVQRLGRNLPALLSTYSSQTGNAELPAPVMGTPLSQLNIPEGLDLEYIANKKGTIDLPHRLMVEQGSGGPIAKWVETDGVTIGTKVRVRNFTYNAQNNTYEFIRDGDHIPALIWTPITRPDDSSTTSPDRAPDLPVDPGNTITTLVPETEIYPEVDRNNPDDYILKSPPGSGLPDTYILFKDPRAEAGIANGYGQPVTGTWLGEDSRSKGAPVPSHIADQLRGQRFKHFNDHRQAMWEAVSKDPALKKQFTDVNLNLMKNGAAPYAPIGEQVGGRQKFEVHHHDEVAKGGAVYDMDNWSIITPAQHILHHKENKQ